MREQPAPCRYASLAEVRAYRHTTWNDVPVCDRCLVKFAAAAATRGRRDGAGSPPDPAPTISDGSTAHADKRPARPV